MKKKFGLQNNKKSFENALRTYGKDSDKWEKISKDLKGEKTPNECKLRYEYCKEQALKKKTKK